MTASRTLLSALLYTFSSREAKNGLIACATSSTGAERIQAALLTTAPIMRLQIGILAEEFWANHARSGNRGSD
jgi:hypothetical protein